MAEPKALDVRLVPNQFLRCMRFETCEQAAPKIRNIPFERDAFPHSFAVQEKMDKLLSFAFRISKSLHSEGKLDLISLVFIFETFLKLTVGKKSFRFEKIWLWKIHWIEHN